MVYSRTLFIYFLSSGDLPNPEIEPGSPALQAYSLPSEPPGSPLACTGPCLSILYIVAHAKSLQLCPILCDPMDCGLPGSSVHGLLQARMLESFAMPYSRGSHRVGYD